MKNGLSKIRNEGIAKAFSYMNFIEAWGTGIPKIFESAKTRNLPAPKIEELGTSFRFVLFRDTGDSKKGQEKGQEIEQRNKEILKEIQENPFVSIKDLENKLGLTTKQVRTSLEKIHAKRKGSAKGGSWEVVD